uniref:hypothetical protein n=1 Tax=Klebsiella pneumoniae TaxID=573 RepID=UPI001D0E6324|nr:hypothetical protein [Klebsiella pneumoniae]
MSTELNQPAITARIIPNNRRMVVTSQGYRGPLQPFLKRSRADMMATLKSNMTCLNIACAGALIDAMMQADARQAATI